LQEDLLGTRFLMIMLGYRNVLEYRKQTSVNRYLCICWLTRKLFGAKRAEVTGEWRRLHNEELYAFYSLQNIIRAIRSRRMRLEGQES
jgi:hypothetical protein